MPTSLAFYRDVLGFQVASEVPADGRCDWVMLTSHGSERMLNTAYEAHERPAAPDAARMAAHGDVILYFDCEDVDAVFGYFRERNIAAKEPTVSDGVTVVFEDEPRERRSYSRNSSTPGGYA